MKHLILIAALIFPLLANGQEVIKIEWRVVGIGDSQLNLDGGARGITGIVLDTRWATYGAANGIINLDGGFAVGASGTCYGRSAGGIGCELQVRGISLYMTMDGEGNGEITVSDEDGFRVEDGAILLESIE